MCSGEEIDMKDDTYSFNDLDIIEKDGKKMFKIKKKPDPEPIDDTLPQDVIDMIGEKNI